MQCLLNKTIIYLSTCSIISIRLCSPQTILNDFIPKKKVCRIVERHKSFPAHSSNTKLQNKPLFFENYKQSSMQSIFPFIFWVWLNTFPVIHTTFQLMTFPVGCRGDQSPATEGRDWLPQNKQRKHREKLILMIYHSQMMPIPEVLKMPQRQLIGRFLGKTFTFLGISDGSWEGFVLLTRLEFIFI